MTNFQFNQICYVISQQLNDRLITLNDITADHIWDCLVMMDEAEFNDLAKTITPKELALVAYDIKDNAHGAMADLAQAEFCY